MRVKLANLAKICISIFVFVTLYGALNTYVYHNQHRGDSANALFQDGENILSSLVRFNQHVDLTSPRFNLSKRLLHHSLVPRNATKWQYEGMVFLNHQFPSIPVNYSIENKHVCLKHKQIHILIYVHSSPQNFDRREALRNSWTNGSVYIRNNLTVAAVFLLGKPENEVIQRKILQENALHDDIVQGDFIDRYRHLTTKAILGIQWITENCPNAEYILKTDDDVFVNLSSLLKGLRFGRNKPKRLLMCNVWQEGAMSILRNPWTCKKWCVTETAFYGSAKYPRYCAGLAFFMTADIIPTMFYIAGSTPYFPIDDIFVTGMLPRGIKNMNYLDIGKKYHLSPNNKVETLKTIVSTKAIVHDRDYRNMKLLWETVNRKKNQ